MDALPDPDGSLRENVPLTTSSQLIASVSITEAVFSDKKMKTEVIFQIKELPLTVPRLSKWKSRCLFKFTKKTSVYYCESSDQHHLAKF